MKTTRTRVRIAVATSVLALAITACGGEAESEQSSGGASAANGGLAATGGTRQSAAGGSSGVRGGTTGSGGMIATGGRLGTGGTSASGGAPVASECNALSNTAAVVTATVVAQNPPTPIGGVIANGTYHLTQYQMFTGPGGSTTSPLPATMQYTIVISSSTGASAFLQGIATVTVGGTSLTEEANVTLSYSGTSYVSTVTCSTVGASGDSGSYTATAQQLVTMSTSSGGETMVATFTRQ
jgi:hypothetical protein